MLTLFLAALTFAFHPAGFDALFYILNYSNSMEKLYFTTIYELMPFALNLRDGVLLVIPITLILFTFIKSKKDLNYELAIPSLALLIISLQSVRFLPFFYIFSSPLMINSFSNFLHGKNHEYKRLFSWLNNFNLILVISIFLILPPIFYHYPSKLGELTFFTNKEFPIKAIQSLNKNPVETKRVFCDYAVAGYVIWEIGDKYKVFIDGRGDLHSGRPTYADYQQIITLRKGWRNTLYGYRIDYIIMYKDSQLTDQLVREGWYDFYHDQDFELIKNPKV